MKKRTGDLWWVSPPAVVGPSVLAVVLVGLGFVVFFVMTDRYLEAVLATTAGIFMLCLGVLDVLGEILGSIRDLGDELGGKKKEGVE
jgi:energy-converting hydrogenase Eha subunit G